MTAPFPHQLWLHLPLPQAMQLHQFVVGENQELLAKLAQLAAPGSQAPALQALYLQGPAASGKSHLLQAVCGQAGAAGQRIAYLPGRLLTEPESLQGLERFHLVALDDLDLLLGQRAWEEALLALYQGLFASRAVLLLAGRTGAQQLCSVLPDLASRLRGAEQYQLQPLDEAGLALMLGRYAARSGLELPPEVLAFLLQRLPRAPAPLLACVDRLDEAALAAQRRLTIPFVKQVLQL